MLVRIPERAWAAAMPAPMNPAPSTPALLTGRGVTDGSLTPGSRDSRFFMKKMPIKLAAIGEPASSPKARSARP